MLPWHILNPRIIDLMHELIKRGIESLEFHLNRPSNQIDKELLARMIFTAQHYPAFSMSQKQEFCQYKVKSV